VASWHVDGGIPDAGSTTFLDPDWDGPNSSFTGGSYYALFQNIDKQDQRTLRACGRNTEHVLGVNTGVRIPPDNLGPPLDPTNTKGDDVYNRWGNASDGFHFFVTFSANFDGLRWVHAAQLGVYSPDGGFGFYELGVDQGSGWTTANPNHPFAATSSAVGDYSVSISGNTVTVTAPGVYKIQDDACLAPGDYEYHFAQSGDRIRELKGLSTGDSVVTLPVTIPLSDLCGPTNGEVCESDLTSVGGFVTYADTTSGTSTNGSIAGITPAVNTVGIAISGGAAGWFYSADTLGDGPACPTPTFGGYLPENPLWVQGQECQIDDTPVRGAILAEFWETNVGFTF